MCIVFYLGSDIQVPTSEWSDEDSRFRVLQLLENEQQVKSFFSKTYVYYLASHEKCGCGFEWDAQRDEKEIEEWSKEWETLSDELKKEIRWSPSDELENYKKRKQSSEDLVDLLKQLLQNTDELEVIVFMDCGQFKEPTSVIIMASDEIIQGRFALYPEDENSGERILYKIKKEE